MEFQCNSNFGGKNESTSQRRIQKMYNFGVMFKCIRVVETFAPNFAVVCIPCDFVM